MPEKPRCSLSCRRLTGGEHGRILPGQISREAFFCGSGFQPRLSRRSQGCHGEASSSRLESRSHLMQKLHLSDSERPMIVKQIEIGHMDNFCYLVGCEKTRKAMAIDPGADVERIMAEAKKERLIIKTIVNTHGHGDHTAGSARLKALTGADIVIHALEAAAVPQADILIIRRSGPAGWRHHFQSISHPRPHAGRHLPLCRGESLHRRHFVCGRQRPHRPERRAPPHPGGIHTPPDDPARRHRGLAGPRLRSHPLLHHRVGKAAQRECKGIWIFR